MLGTLFVSRAKPLEHWYAAYLRQGQAGLTMKVTANPVVISCYPTVYLTRRTMLRQKRRPYGLYAICFVLMAFGCAPRANIQTPKTGIQITSATLSPDAGSIAMTIRRRVGGASRLLIYDIKADQFQLPPLVDKGWSIKEPSFSPDQNSVAVGAVCLEGCSDKSDQTRILIYDLPSGLWRTAVSGIGYRGSPRFTPDGAKLLYMRGKHRIKMGSNDVFLEIGPLLNYADINTGKETPLGLVEDKFDFYAHAQIGADTAIYFVGITRKNARFGWSPYRLPIRKVGKELVVIGRPTLLEDIWSFSGRSDVLQFEMSADGRRTVFLSVTGASFSARKERIQVVENGAARVVLSTQMHISRLSLSADGGTILLLGDPNRRLLGADYARANDGIYDFFLVDVDRGAIRELPLRRKIDNLNVIFD